MLIPLCSSVALGECGEFDAGRTGNKHTGVLSGTGGGGI